MQIRNELSRNFLTDFGKWKSLNFRFFDRFENKNWQKKILIKDINKISQEIYIYIYTYTKVSTFELIGFLKNGLYCFLMDELMFCACNFDYCSPKLSEELSWQFSFEPFSHHCRIRPPLYIPCTSSHFSMCRE